MYKSRLCTAVNNVEAETQYSKEFTLIPIIIIEQHTHRTPTKL